MIFNFFLFLTFFAFIFLTYSFFSFLKLKKRVKIIKSKLNLDFTETLNLATAEQLLKELRKRVNMPFILLIPIKEKDFNGVTIESHGMNAISSLAILHLAKSIFMHGFKKKGQQLPNLPPLEDYF